jgi:hypothetical protein
MALTKTKCALILSITMDLIPRKLSYFKILRCAQGEKFMPKTV